MRVVRLQIALLAVSSFGASACSWSRFDDVTSNAPIVLFSKPGSMKQGFGASLATASTGQSSQVLVGGALGVSGAALFEIGDQDAPGTTSIDSGFCSPGSCFLASSLAGFANATGPDQSRASCFAVGGGSVNTPGIVMRCQDTSEYTLAIPPLPRKWLEFGLENQQPYDFPLAADRTDDPVLLAAFPDKQVAWFYPAKSSSFAPLTPPPGLAIEDASFGKSLAVLTSGSERVFALGVPGKSQVLLWKTVGETAAKYIGCLGGVPGTGRALASGRVDADADEDLVVSDDNHVLVIAGRALFGLPPTESTECGFGLLPPGAVLGSFGCASAAGLSGCSNSEFGAALAVGDLDGDGDGEVIVGAPRMNARDEASAGALLVFDAESASDEAFVDAKFISSAEAGDQLGRSIVTPHIGGRDIIAAGAPGNAKAALFYCSPLLPAGAAGSRCP